MKNQFYILVAAVAAFVFTGCSKDDEGGGSEAQFHVQASSKVVCTDRIPVRFSVACDAAPTVTFTTEEGTLGIVSMDGFTSYDSEKIYAGEPIEVKFGNGVATTEFRYIPLSTGSHTVTFTASYTQNGVAKTATSRQVLTVAEDASKEFNPDVYQDEIGYYVYNFRKAEAGVEYRVGLGSLEGKTGEHPDYVTIMQDKEDITMEKDAFHPITWNRWGDCSSPVVVRSWYEDDQHDEGWYSYRATSPITLTLIFRDACDRCRDVVIETDAQGKVVSSVTGDYYLWRNRK